MLELSAVVGSAKRPEAAIIEWVGPKYTDTLDASMRAEWKSDWYEQDEWDGELKGYWRVADIYARNRRDQVNGWAGLSCRSIFASLILPLWPHSPLRIYLPLFTVFKWFG
jgi:hypothetical protein